MISGEGEYSDNNLDDIEASNITDESIEDY